MTQILHFCPDKPQRICQLHLENNQRIAIGYQMLNFYTQSQLLANFILPSQYSIVLNNQA
jgi:hypothetical protein